MNAKAFSLSGDFSTDSDGYVSRMEFNLKIWGDAVKHRSFFIFSIMGLADGGLGKNRTTLKIDYIYDRMSGELLYGSLPELGPDMQEDIDEYTGGNKIYLRLQTPVRLNANRNILINIGPYEIIESIHNRLKLLQEAYNICGSHQISPLNLPCIKVEQKKVKWVRWERYSSVQRKRLRMGGYIGYMVFSPKENELIKWLSIGEVIGVGIGTSMGLGSIKYKIL